MMRTFSYRIYLKLVLAAGICLAGGNMYARTGNPSVPVFQKGFMYGPGENAGCGMGKNEPVGGCTAGKEKESFIRIRKGTAAGEEARLERLADSVLSTLTLRQKIAQLMVIDISSADGAKRKLVQNELVKKEKVGGVILMDDKLVPAMNRMNQLHKMAPVPLLVTIDGEWGASMRFKELPVFPRLMQLGALSSDTLVYRMGYAVGKECRDLNIHVNYSPDVDINNNPENPVINTRSFGENKEKVTGYGRAFMKGMKDAGTAGSAKHFPGHGDTDVDSHKGLPHLPFSRERLDSLELYPFRQMIAAGADMVMVGHLSVPALDATGKPASVSKPIITGLLRNELGFDGIIVTDALNMNGVCESLEKKMVPLEAYKAGSDLLLMPVQVKDAITEIEKAVRSGRLSADSLDEKCRRILRLKARAGLFDKGYNPLVPVRNLEKKMIKEENLHLMEEIARQSVTVLFNRPAYVPAAGSTGVGGTVKTGKEIFPPGETSKGYAAAGEGGRTPVLPVGRLENKKIAYLGLGVKEGDSEMGTLLRRYAPVDTVIFRQEVPADTLAAVRERLAEYDLIILGIHKTDSRPHKNFGLDTVQMQYLTQWAAGQNMVAVYFGSPYALERIPGYENFRALIIGYSNTPENNRAAAQIIFGGVPARGVLPVSTVAFRAGESAVLAEQTRLGFRFGPDRIPYRVEDGQVRGDYIPRRASEEKEKLTGYTSGTGTDSEHQVSSGGSGETAGSIAGSGNAALSGQDTIWYNTPLSVGEISPLLTILPRIAALIEKGYFKSTDFLGDVIRLPIPKHSNILILDLLTQRSGLPAVGKDFDFNMNNITNLNISPARDMVYSKANLYYLYRILREYEGGDSVIAEHARRLFASLGMGDTHLGNEPGLAEKGEDGIWSNAGESAGRISQPQPGSPGKSAETLTKPAEYSGSEKEFLQLLEATSTADDLSKFLRMIYNGGRYGGSVYLEPGAAALLDMVLSYYAAEPGGLKIITDPQGKKISYTYEGK